MLRENLQLSNRFHFIIYHHNGNKAGRNADKQDLYHVQQLVFYNKNIKTEKGNSEHKY